MSLLSAAFLSWIATVKLAYEPPREAPEGHLYVRGEKVRFEQGDTVALWDGRRLTVKIGAHKPAPMDPSLRAAFVIPPTCLEPCGWERKGEEVLGGVTTVTIFAKIFAKTPMGPLKQFVWVAADGLPRKMETRSARGVTRVELHPTKATPPVSEKLFRF